MSQADKPNQVEWIIGRQDPPLDWIFCSEYSERTFGITCNP